MSITELIKKCKEFLRILDNYYISQEIRIQKVSTFFKEVINFEYEQIKILDSKFESVFDVLCKDIIKQCEFFISSKKQNLADAKNLLNLIISIENYIFDIEKLPWKLGRKISHFEKSNIRRIFRKTLHSLFNLKTKRPVRGTKVRVEIIGSLAKGYSDWKLINGGNIPKPSDYGIPREYRKTTKSIYRKLDEELILPQKLKPLMSDVDILIMNEVIFDSINPEFSINGWSFKLGEKYTAGVGTSSILEKIHQSLINTKISGIKGRWVNFVVVRDEEGFKKQMIERKKVVSNLERKTGKIIEIKDILILDEIIY